MLQSDRREKMESLSDEDLVRRCWNELPGTTISFDYLVKRYKDYVFWVALKRLEKVEDAEDVAQETFVRVFFGLKQFRLESTFKTWLTRIAINVCLTMALSQRGIFWRSFVSINGNPDVENIYDSLLTRQQEKSFWSTVGDVLRKMFVDYRKIFILRYFKNKSLEQLRILLKLTLGAVKMRIKRAKEQFMEILRGSE
jgi:RNA polymerase sigma-70 factor (ECF subfamily)